MSRPELEANIFLSVINHQAQPLLNSGNVTWFQHLDTTVGPNYKRNFHPQYGKLFVAINIPKHVLVLYSSSFWKWNLYASAARHCAYVEDKTLGYNYPCVELQNYCTLLYLIWSPDWPPLLPLPSTRLRRWTEWLCSICSRRKLVPPWFLPCSIVTACIIHQDEKKRACVMASSLFKIMCQTTSVV